MDSFFLRVVQIATRGEGESSKGEIRLGNLLIIIHGSYTSLCGEINGTRRVFDEIPEFGDGGRFSSPALRDLLQYSPLSSRVVQGRRTESELKISRLSTVVCTIYSSSGERLVVLTQQLSARRDGRGYSRDRSRASLNLVYTALD